MGEITANLTYNKTSGIFYRQMRLTSQAIVGLTTETLHLGTARMRCHALIPTPIPAEGKHIRQQYLLFLGTASSNDTTTPNHQNSKITSCS